MSRRASEAMEFALTLPVLLALLSGLVDFGWYYSQQSRLHEAVRHGARVGAVTPRDDGPLAAARSAVDHQLAATSVPFTPQVTTGFVTDATGDELVRVEADASYVGLWNLVRAPYRLHASATMRMEEQPGP